MYPRWLWPLSSLPGVVWLLILFLLPLYAVLALAFGSVDPILLSGVPAWNPLDWNPGWISHVLDLLVPGNILWDVFLRTCRYVAISLAGCILIGYPVAYYVARHASRTKALLLILLVLPFWISYLMRMLASIKRSWKQPVTWARARSGRSGTSRCHCRRPVFSAAPC